MKVILLSLFTLLAFSYTPQERAKIIYKEYMSLKEKALNTTADYDLAGYYQVKEYGDILFMWRLDDNEAIRIYKERPDGTPFAITYHKTDIIIDGKIVLRRFYGPEPIGWRNDTLDFETGEYLGMQGHRTPFLRKEERDIFKDWDLTIFND